MNEELDVSKIIHDAFISTLSGLNETKAGKIWCKDNNGDDVFVTIINSENEHCILEWYYDDVRKRAQVECKDGQMNGKYTEWFVEGSKSYETEYLNDKKVGGQVWYNKDGTILKKLQLGFVNPGTSPTNAQPTRPKFKVNRSGK